MAPEMKVEKVFRFQDGRTVFVGSHAQAVKAARAELWVGDRKVEEFAVEEMVPEKRTPSDKRSVATRAPVQVADADVDAGRCTLRWAT